MDSWTAEQPESDTDRDTSCGLAVWVVKGETMGRQIDTW